MDLQETANMDLQKCFLRDDTILELLALLVSWSNHQLVVLDQVDINTEY